MDIQWYPGHMAKTKRLLIENVKLVDVVIELLDARIPVSSQNPEFEWIFANKKRIKVFNKADLADERVSREWKSHYQAKGISSIFINSKTGQGFKEMYSETESMLRYKFEADAKRGINRRPVKAMVVGIPNVGKSTFINKLSGRAAAKTGDKPGITKSKQWIRLNDRMHLLDTPGILWPKFEDAVTGRNLAFTGAVKDEIMNQEELAEILLEKISVDYGKNLSDRYGITIESSSGNQLLAKIASARNYLLRQGEPDISKTSRIILDEFRGGVIGRISLERPDNEAKPVKE
jgi:ribosome biogenesis GTPase A